MSFDIVSLAALSGRQIVVWDKLRTSSHIATGTPDLLNDTNLHIAKKRLP